MTHLQRTLQDFPKIGEPVSPKLGALSELDHSNLNTQMYKLTHACASTHTQ